MQRTTSQRITEESHALFLRLGTGTSALVLRP